MPLTRRSFFRRLIGVTAVTAGGLLIPEVVAESKRGKSYFFARDWAKPGGDSSCSVTFVHYGDGRTVCTELHNLTPGPNGEYIYTPGHHEELVALPYNAAEITHVVTQEQVPIKELCRRYPRVFDPSIASRPRVGIPYRQIPLDTAGPWLSLRRS